MKIVIFGLSVSSSWGNGHATLWRGLLKALARRGHDVVFFERDTPFYRDNRDLHALDDAELVIFPDWETVESRASREVSEADVAIVTSYCPDALRAERLLLDAARPLRVFYDLDTPVTLARLAEAGGLEGRDRPAYVGPSGFAGYDLVLSYTGGPALVALVADLGARRVAPLYGHVDPALHRPVPPQARFASDLSYLGTYAADRQVALEALFVAPARARPARRFLIGGAQYPADFPWTANIFFKRHVAPPDHPSFFSSGRLTLNVTRRAMAEMGWCPSGRLFEAAACGAAILTDAWAGLDSFFAPGTEVLVAGVGEDALAAVDLSDAELRRIAEAGRARALEAHTSDHRAGDFEVAIEAARSGGAHGAGVG